MSAASTLTLHRAVISMSLNAPFEVFLNYQVVADYGDDEAAAEAHYQALRTGKALPQSRGDA